MSRPCTFFVLHDTPPANEALPPPLPLCDRGVCLKPHPSFAEGVSPSFSSCSASDSVAGERPKCPSSAVGDHHRAAESAVMACFPAPSDAAEVSEVPMKETKGPVFAELQGPQPKQKHNPATARSNLDCFLLHTTPAVQCHYPSKSSIADFMGKREKSPSDSGICMPYFNLGDLWSSYDEWSAYGAGVPLCLPTGETIVQYYVPYLSAVQIYVHSASNPLSKQRRGVGYDSDSSDSGEFSSDNEPLQSPLRPENWDTASSGSSERSSSMDDGSSEHAGSRRGDLVFEFFENCSPYGRAPLKEKITELAVDFPHLLTLQSNELSPASWISVAWYPIYRIPMGPTMRDLATCFLTFHSLWTPSMLQEETMASRDGEDSQDGEPFLQMRIKSETLELPAFGLASYKLRGPFWASAAPADKRRASSLASSADSWLKQLRVQHPDFIFFASRGSSCGTR